MKEYTLIFCTSLDGLFLLVEKDKPEWQKGKFNLPGGKIETGETIIECAKRELTEESGLFVDNMKEFGQILDGDSIVHCMFCTTDRLSNFELFPDKNETQSIAWHSWNSIRNDRRLIANLNIIIPLMLAGQDNWKIEDNEHSCNMEEHTIKISICRSV